MTRFRQAAGVIAASTLLSACVASEETTVRDPGLAARVAELEAKEEIRAVLVNYGRFLDGRDYAAYAGLFAENGVWTGGFGTFEGRGAIERMLGDNLGARPPLAPDAPLGSLHLLSNELIELDPGLDAARAISKWFFVMPGEDGAPRLLMAGRYDDEFVREGGRWVIARRAALGDMPADE